MFETSAKHVSDEAKSNNIPHEKEHDLVKTITSDITLANQKIPGSNPGALATCDGLG